MWHVILLGFLGGLLGGNALPHFVRGITKRNYPSMLGNGPIPNLVAGWSGLILAALCLWWADLPSHPVAAFVSVSVGVLAIGLFHAGPGAFGRPTGEATPTRG
jgi:hypothetical protein